MNDAALPARSGIKGGQTTEQQLQPADEKGQVEGVNN